MNERELRRHIGRIPRLIFHISRTEDPERKAGFEAELKRRRYQLLADGREDLVEELMSIKLEPQKNEDFERIKEIETREIEALNG